MQLGSCGSSMGTTHLETPGSLQVLFAVCRTDKVLVLTLMMASSAVTAWPAAMAWVCRL